MSSAELTLAQIKAKGLPEKVRNKEVLNGLAEIAAHLNWSISKVRKAIKLYGLPATSGSGEQGKQLTTTKALIQHWIMQSHLDISIKRGWVE